MCRSANFKAAARKDIGPPFRPGCPSAHSMYMRYPSARCHSSIAQCGATHGADVPLPGLGTQREPELLTFALRDRRGRLNAFRNHFALFFGQRRVDVQGEVVDIAAEQGHDKMQPCAP